RAQSRGRCWDYGAFQVGLSRVMARKYPLEALGTLREDAADRAAREVSDAVRQREAAQRHAKSAERDRAEAEASAGALRAEEAKGFERGELTAADLARAHAWEHQATQEREALLVRERKAAEAAEKARAAEEKARTELAVREADAMVVEKDRGRWKQRE